MIVHGVLNGDPLDPEVLRTISQGCDYVLAADGGLKHLVAAGVDVDGVVGDMDSVGETLVGFGGKVVSNSDQDHSDVEKLLAQATKVGATGVVLTCAHGGRVDHLLNSMLSALVLDLEVLFLFPEEWCFAIPFAGQWVFEGSVGQRVSVMPFGALRLSLSGVKWPLDNAVLHAPGHTSISNVAVEPLVELKVFAGQGWIFGGYDQVEVPTWFRLRHSTTAL